MAEDKKPTSDDLFKLLSEGLEGRQAVEQAIQKNLQSFSENAGQEINKLVQANTLGPDVAQEMLALNKAVIEQTTDLIKKTVTPSMPTKADKE